MRRRDRHHRQPVRKAPGRLLATSLVLGGPYFPLGDHADHIHMGY